MCSYIQHGEEEKSRTTLLPYCINPTDEQVFDCRRSLNAGQFRRSKARRCRLVSPTRRRGFYQTLARGSG